MSVTYRALWSDSTQADAEDYLSQLSLRFSRWALGDASADALDDGTVEVPIAQNGPRTISLRKVVDDAAENHGVEAITNDRQTGAATAWKTIVRAIANDAKVQVLVEVQMDTDEVASRIKVGRPRIVDDLLSIEGKPVLGGSAVLAGALKIDAGAALLLVDILRSPGRTLPTVVCSEPQGDLSGDWLRNADKIATRVAGIANVLTLDSAAVAAFRQELGDLAIWGGGVRVYVPVPVSDESEGWRHRYTPGGRMHSSPQSNIDRIVYSVAQLSSRRRVPDSFDLFAGVQEREAALDVQHVLEEFESERSSWERERDTEVAERSEIEKELARATGHLSRLKDELLLQGLGDLLWGTQYEITAGVPDEVQDTSEAVLAAQTYLSDWLTLPDSAVVREIVDIDTATNAFAWGNTTWRGLRALAAYAKDRSDGWSSGGFWEWCIEGRPLVWPATTKKLSMTESESLQSSAKLMATRHLEVSSAVSKSGRIHMLAHLKIAEGGGNLAPRVYFHDDTGGETKNVHVGFVGPHYLVPNTQAS